jgi:hypothetical protein
MFAASFAVTYTANLAELAAKNWTAEQHEADHVKAGNEINRQQYEAEQQQTMFPQFEIIGGGPALVYQCGLPK